VQTRRDQLQAHVFVVTRLVSALMRADPDQPERPLRRTATGGVAGLAVAVVILAASTVYHLSGQGGAQAWQQAGAIIVDKGTGTRYVYLGGVLRPALNYASARLAAGGAQAQVRMVSGKMLDSVPHGRPVGIPGAPDQLPAVAGLRTGPWLLCLTGSATPRVSVSLAGDRDATDLPDSEAVLVTDASGTDRYLIQRGTRLPIPDQASLSALGYSSAVPGRAATAWLNAFAEAPPLRAPEIAHRGAAGPVLDGHRRRVGQVLQVPVAGGALEYYVVLADGLLPVTTTLARLILSDPATAQAYPDGPAQQVTVSAAAAVRARRSATVLTAADFPELPPRLDTLSGGTRALCARLSFDPGRGVTVRLTTVAAGAAGAGLSTRKTDPAVADTVQVPAGSGALVVAQAAPGVPAGTTYLITDLGVKYPLAGTDVQEALGYAGVTPVAVPTTVLALLPTGPALNSTAARTEAPMA
jgi:type VII secretion protein EccB